MIMEKRRDALNVPFMGLFPTLLFFSCMCMFHSVASKPKSRISRAQWQEDALRHRQELTTLLYPSQDMYNEENVAKAATIPAWDVKAGMPLPALKTKNNMGKGKNIIEENENRINTHPIYNFLHINIKS